MESYYKLSGNLNKIRLALALIIISVLSIFLGYLYAIISIWIPLVYVQFFIPIGLGIVIMHSIFLLTRFTKNRNKKSQITLTIFFSALTFYFQWCAFVLYAIHNEMPEIQYYFANLLSLLNPINLVSIIIEINQIGMWSVFGITFTGFLLWLVWIIEAGIIFGLPLIGVTRAEPTPYSEKLDKWYKKYTLDEIILKGSRLLHKLSKAF